ncbi:Spermatogenesis-associated protein 4 [Trypanosoma theileri]|uniref:Spermatogenesis-associated protein 4 n=1 Tax=Trypanosoma theileri TaxID=67003 RepID=A0A1X0P6B7_9TRYP|nr:Spermatogenesis-associated protein 4 [Trypanosoma theileri]ORC92477.1 Spermatogenesis-associated protein 4 [Trypanosoma theileri]
MQREVIKWLQSLDLTYQVKYPQQDLSNGFILAEIASRYDRRVAMHSYVPGCSTECKRRNWKVLLRDLARIGCTTITKEMAEATIQAKPGVAITVLENLYEFFYGRPVPARTKDNTEQVTAMVKVIDTLSERKEPTPTSSQKERSLPLSLQVMENDEIALGSGLQKPGFARPTASTLLHVANRETRNAQLIASVPPDELRVLKRNEKILNEHEILHKAYRYAEPHRFAPVSHQRRVLAEKKSRKGVTGPKGIHDAHRKTVERVSVVEVNTLNKKLLGALRSRQNSFDGTGERGMDESPERKARVVLEECGNDLRLGLSKLIDIALESNCFGDVLEDLKNEEVQPDILSNFVGQREQMPFGAVLACWSSLLSASDGIASTLLIRPTEYMYLLRAIHFIFAAEVVHIRLLHVSSSQEKDSVLQGGLDTTNKVPRGGRRAQRSMSVCDSILMLTDSVKPQQALFSNERVFNVTSAFSFFCRIGASLHAISPSAALSLLTMYFIPTASPLFLTASVAILEAIARVVVSHVCGDGSDEIITERPSIHVDLSGKEQQQQQQQQGQESHEEQKKQIIPKWNAIEELNNLLTGPIKAAFFQNGTNKSTTSGTQQQRIQYNLFIYQVLSHARTVLDMTAEVMIEEEANASLSLLAPRHYLSSLLDVCSRSVYPSLGSLSLHERSIGVAMLLQLIACDQWELAIDPLVFVISELRRSNNTEGGGVGGGGLLQRAAEAWEIRVLLLELLTTAFRKALYVMADECEEVENSTTMPPSSSSTSSRVSLLAQIIKQKMDFTALEEATVYCLLQFSDAPLLQRQLALQIVARRLLPDEQRQVAAVWLRGLFVFSVDQLDFLLRPHEAEPLNMPDPTEATQRRAIPSATTSRRATIVEDVEERSVISSLRVLLGRVEPAYVVAPLNQSWDTFSVVQAALMFEDILTTAQLFSVILAALLSPQHHETQRVRLMQNLRAVNIVSSEGAVVDIRSGRNSETKEESSYFSVHKHSDEDEEDTAALTFTLRSLVGMEGRKGVTAVEVVKDKTKEETNDDDDVNEKPETGEATETVNKENDILEMMESHVKAFWSSVTRLIKPQLQECLHQTGNNVLATGKEDVRSVCRISASEDIAQLQDLAMAVLFTLHRRYGGSSSSTGTNTNTNTAAALTPNESRLNEALHWLENM